MESSTVKGAIDGLIQARPGSSSASSLAGSSPPSGGGANKGQDQPAVKRAVTKRRSHYIPNPSVGWKCNCGKCTKCLPSPSGESFIRIPSFPGARRGRDTSPLPSPSSFFPSLHLSECLGKRLFSGQQYYKGIFLVSPAIRGDVTPAPGLSIELDPISQKKSWVNLDRLVCVVSFMQLHE